MAPMVCIGIHEWVAKPKLNGNKRVADRPAWMQGGIGNFAGLHGFACSVLIACGEDMSSKRARISDGATLEELQALLMKAAKQLRSIAPPGDDVSILDQLEAEMEQMKARRKAALV